MTQNTIFVNENDFFDPKYNFVYFYVLGHKMFYSGNFDALSSKHLRISNFLESLV